MWRKLQVPFLSLSMISKLFFSDLRSKLCSERRARAPGFAGKVKYCIIKDTQVIWVD